MQHRYLTFMSIIASAVFVLVVAGRPATAAPLSRLIDNSAAETGLVQKVHGRHCRRRYGGLRHWHGGYGHVHRKVHRHGRCYRSRRYTRRYYGAYVGPRFYGHRRYGYRRYGRRHRRGVSIRLRF
ncbi:MAG: hypothetical protein ACI89J_004022 [Hyphomicrobiaceae bacterium]|jgi:hypothetical protein